MIKTQFGYHILQVEEKQTAHLKPLDEVKAQILATLTRQQEADQQASYAQQLATEAAKSGLAKTAEAHHLQLVTTDYVPQNAVLPDFLTDPNCWAWPSAPSREPLRR